VHFAPHPEPTTRPEIFWNQAYPDDAALWRNARVHPYRADWFAQATESAESGSAASDLAYTHPEHAFELLLKDYARFAAPIGPALQHSAEYSYKLLEWADLNRVELQQSRASVERSILKDGDWGMEYADIRGHHKFARRVIEWAADHRTEDGSAAVRFLLRHPREPIGPYVELLRGNLSSTYRSLPALSTRGFVLSAADTTDPKWAYHLALSKFSRENGDYLPALRRDPVWLVGYLLARDGKIDPRLARETAAQLKSEHPKHPLLARALAVLVGGPTPAIPPVLAEGRQAELSALQRLQRSKNREVYRPTDEQMKSEDFKLIVGPPRYTERGYAKGTVIDVTEGEWAEIKSGGSPLEPTYQLRLQAYRAHAENRPLHIYTDRPISPQFEEQFKSLGVAIDPLPK